MTLGVLAVGDGLGFGLMLLADPVQHHLYDVSLYLLIIGTGLIMLAMPLELILLARPRRRTRASALSPAASRPTPKSGHKVNCRRVWFTR